MNGKAIRHEAREQVRGRRGVLLLAVVLSNLPSFFCSQILPRVGFEVPRPLNWIVSLFCALLGLGVIKIALEQMAGKEKTLLSLFFSFQRGVLLNALLITVLLNLFSILINTVTVLFGTTGMVISLNAAVVLGLVLFPVRYYFVLNPNRPLYGCLKKGLSLGFHWCGDVFVFHFWLYGPILLGYILFVVLTVLSRGSLAIIFILFIVAVIGITVLFRYLPYVTLAQAMFAMELIQDEERIEPPTPLKRHMSLVKKGGWCRVNTVTGKGAKNLALKKDGEAIER